MSASVQPSAHHTHKGSMNIQFSINLPDALSDQAKELEHSIKLFADQKVQEALEHENKHIPTQTKPSKWARLAERIENDPDLANPEFQKAWGKMREDMQEFREGFRFEHDLADEKA